MFYEKMIKIYFIFNGNLLNVIFVVVGNFVFMIWLINFNFLYKRKLMLSLLYVDIFL